jgi:aldose 1-epimerase
VETLRAGDATVTIDHEHGGRLSSVVVGGHELLLAPVAGHDEPLAWGCFPMVPWAGRIRHGRFHHDGDSVEVPRDLPPHAIHGTAYVRPWRATASGRLETDLGDDWPWQGRVTQQVDLSPGQLTLTMTLDADEAMPVSAGWHPWLRRRIAGVSAQIELPAERMWHRDAQGIPDGTLVEPAPPPWDDCFTALVGPVVVRWPGVLELVVESDCEHVVVYDEQDVALCVEPQSAPPDAHNSGEDLVVVGDEDPWSITMAWMWQRLG